jgi:hypothetical protein
MKSNRIRRIVFFSTAAIALLGFNSCVPLAAAGVGYIAHEEGYRVTNPIKKVEE